MQYVSFVLAGAVVLFGSGAAAQTQPQSKPAQPPASETSKAQSSSSTQQVTVTGCLRQTSDDPKVFALVEAKPAKAGDQPTGTSGTAMRSPLFRLEEPGTPSLKPHVGKRVEVTGSVVPAKDEKGADIVTTTRETIGVDTVTIRTLDLKPVPAFQVKSVKATGDCPAPKSKQ